MISESQLNNCVSLGDSLLLMFSMLWQGIPTIATAAIVGRGTVTSSYASGITTAVSGHVCHAASVHIAYYLLQYTTVHVVYHQWSHVITFFQHYGGASCITHQCVSQAQPNHNSHQQVHLDALAIAGLVFNALKLPFACTICASMT